MATHKPRIPDWFIIVVDTGEDTTLDTTRVDLSLDATYAELLQKEKNRELVSPHPTVVPRACLKQTPDMLLEDYFDERTQTNKKRFKEDLVIYRTDENGRIWVSKDYPQMAREELRNQRSLKRKAWLDPMGCMLDEELPEHMRNAAPNKGGRPRKDPTSGLTDVGR